MNMVVNMLLLKNVLSSLCVEKSMQNVKHTFVQQGPVVLLSASSFHYFKILEQKKLSKKWAKYITTSSFVQELTHFYMFNTKLN